MADDELTAAEKAGRGCGVCMIKPWTREGLIGAKNYDYSYLCTPTMPWRKGGVEPPYFIGKDEKLPLLLSLLMGFQHSLAMVAGIATSGGLLIAGDACFAFQLDSEMCAAKQYMVSAAWIASGLLTVVQVFRARILGTKYYLGTGLISVMGTSFTFLPIARDMVISSISEARGAGLCTGTNNDCVGYGKNGYGRFLGTCMVASLLEVGLAMSPPRYIKALFPPVVTGTAVLLIGGGLISSGVKYLGGGVFCGENAESKVAAGFGVPQLCNENGQVVLTFGAPEYIGLGCSVIFASTLVQFFGSPFLKSTFLFWGLAFGCFVAAVTYHTAVPGDKTTCFTEPDKPCIGGFADATPGKKYYYYSGENIQAVEPFTFLWVTTFPLGFAVEYFLPILIGFFISTAETVGDIGLSYIASELPTGERSDVDSRIQGGLLGDGLNSLFACLMTTPPNTTFSQNNGVIALTRCASRSAGFSCAAWLVLYGVFGQIGGLFTSIPICVVGGMVLQLFTMVFVSGMKMACTDMTRRNSFILTLALSFGLGVAMEPHLFEGGGGFAFYSQNLAHNTGFWPKALTCAEFPTMEVITVLSPASCNVGGTVVEVAEEVCTTLDGTFTAEVSVTEDIEVETCTNNNGNCCNAFNEGAKTARTTVIMILRTPYCIGFLIACFLNLLLPEDKQELKEMEKEKEMVKELEKA